MMQLSQLGWAGLVDNGFETHVDSKSGHGLRKVTLKQRSQYVQGPLDHIERRKLCTLAIVGTTQMRLARIDS